MTLEELCAGIRLQPEICRAVLTFYHGFDFEPLQGYLEGLKDMRTEEKARRRLQQVWGEDPKGVKMLTCMLLGALELYPWYQKQGIDREVFWNTMGCFTRFIGECREADGEYRFDREWWTARQISGRLFRLGALEYELKQQDEKPVVSIHIPSDAVLTGENCDVSIRRARAFMAAHFEEYANAEYICHSWLLAEELKDLLREGSHILEFQKRFDVQDETYGGTEYCWWVFKTRSTDAAVFPEKTSLQKSMKKFLQAGGRIGEGYGVLSS